MFRGAAVRVFSAVNSMGAIVFMVVLLSSLVGLNLPGGPPHEAYGCGVAERHGRPGRSGGGDPLIAAVGEAALEVRLELRGAAHDVPASVGSLGFEQVLRAPAPRRCGGGDAEFVHGVERLAGGVSVGG